MAALTSKLTVSGIMKDCFSRICHIRNCILALATFVSQTARRLVTTIQLIRLRLLLVLKMDSYHYWALWITREYKQSWPDIICFDKVSPLFHFIKISVAEFVSILPKMWTKLRKYLYGNIRNKKQQLGLDWMIFRFSCFQRWDFI